MLFKERADGPTPNGGSYSEIYYRDDDGNPVDKEVATRCEIVEHDADGMFISSTLGFLEKKKNKNALFGAGRSIYSSEAPGDCECTSHSVIEHIVHIDGVTGSSPVATTCIPA